MLEEHEELLKVGLFDPPADFTDRIMEGIAVLPLPDFPPHHPHHGRERIQWLALVGAALLGVAQLAAFMFGIWSATSAA